jgi:hypothetical protein
VEEQPDAATSSTSETERSDARERDRSPIFMSESANSSCNEGRARSRLAWEPDDDVGLLLGDRALTSRWCCR